MGTCAGFWAGVCRTEEAYNPCHGPTIGPTCRYKGSGGQSSGRKGPGRADKNPVAGSWEGGPRAVGEKDHYNCANNYHYLHNYNYNENYFYKNIKCIVIGEVMRI